jgi:hypothetical protein
MIMGRPRSKPAEAHVEPKRTARLAKIDFARDYSTIHGPSKAMYYQDGKEFDANGIELGDGEVVSETENDEPVGPIDESTLAEMLEQ